MVNSVAKAAKKLTAFREVSAPNTHYPCQIEGKEAVGLGQQRKLLLQAFAKTTKSSQTTMHQHRLASFLLAQLSEQGFVMNPYILLAEKLIPRGLNLGPAVPKCTIIPRLRSEQDVLVDVNFEIKSLWLENNFTPLIPLLRQFFTITEEADGYTLQHTAPLLKIDAQYQVSLDEKHQLKLDLVPGKGFKITPKHFLINELLPALWPVLLDQETPIDLQNTFARTRIEEVSLVPDALGVYVNDLERDSGNCFYLNDERVMPRGPDESFADYQQRFEAQLKAFFTQHSPEKAEQYFQFFREQFHQSGFVYALSRLLIKSFHVREEGQMSVSGRREFRLNAKDGEIIMEAYVDVPRVIMPPDYSEPLDVTCYEGDCIFERSDAAPLMQFSSKYRMYFDGKDRGAVECVDARVKTLDPYIQKATTSLPEAPKPVSFWEKTKAWANANPTRTKAVGVGLILLVAAAVVVTSVLTAGAALPVWAIVLSTIAAALFAGGAYAGGTLLAVRANAKTREQVEDEKFGAVAANVFARVAPTVPSQLQSVLTEKPVVNVDLKVVEAPEQAPQVELKITPVVPDVETVSVAPRRSFTS